MDKLNENELRRVLNQVTALLDASMALAGADEDLQKRLRGIRERVRDEELRLPRLPAAGRAY
jgi:hypothetical protein